MTGNWSFGMEVTRTGNCRTRNWLFRASTIIRRRAQQQRFLRGCGHAWHAPTINEFCVEQAVRTGSGPSRPDQLHIAFDRKKLLLPDLTRRGYQISQLLPPIVGEGEVCWWSGGRVLGRR